MFSGIFEHLEKHVIYQFGFKCILQNAKLVTIYFETGTMPISMKLHF